MRHQWMLTRGCLRPYTRSDVASMGPSALWWSVSLTSEPRLSLETRSMFRDVGLRLGAAALLAFALSTWPQSASAQEGGLWTLYSAETPEGGPPSSNVGLVLPVESGIVAITQQGAAFFDGHQWNEAEIPLKSGEKINTVAPVWSPATGASLWFGTSEGIHDSASPAIGLDLGRLDVTAILQASDGSTWIGTSNDLKRLMPDRDHAIGTCATGGFRPPKRNSNRGRREGRYLDWHPRSRVV